LARHGGMDGYVAAKRRIFQGMERRGTAIVAVDDDHTRAIAADLARAGVTVVPVSAEGPCDGAHVIDGVLHDGRNGPVIDLTGIPALPGRHNWQNAAAAYAATRAAGADPAMILEGLRSFPGLAHRQQLVAEHEGVRFVNDSKATNADAAAKALVCYDPIYWILGGRAKEGGLDGLEPLMPRVRHAYLIGEATEDFAAWLGRNGVPFSRCGTLDRAVAAAAAQARAEAQAGACVLLSPACASWDQFASFEQRGAAFADLVRSDRVHQEAVPAGGAA
ncbi:MAG TPA: Mur ligase family protein, partial [Acetobacteraceae bacterium]